MNILKLALTFAAVQLWLYLYGSFANADFNIGSWSASSRAFLAFMGVVLGSTATLLVDERLEKR